MIIYKTTNIINGKFYIGQDYHNNPKYLGSGNLLKAAIKKYGKENFVKEIIEVCSSKEELNEREIYWIKETKAQEYGYNIADGGFGASGYIIDDSVIEKRRQTRAKNPEKYKLSEERKKQIGDFHRGKKISEEQKKKLSKRMKNFNNYSKEFIAMQNKENKSGEKSYMWGKKVSEETRKKQSEARKKNPTKYWLGKKQSIESNQKRSRTLKGTKKSTEQKQKITGKNNPFYGKIHTPESKEKIKQARQNKTPEQLLGIYIKFYTTKVGYEPSEEQKQKKLKEYINKKRN